jgi:hypothetical protein
MLDMNIFMVIEYAQRQDDVARAYASEILSCIIGDKTKETDWRKVNKAIIDGWSLADLEYIRLQAWSMVVLQQKIREEMER